jgi:hypothetical protein
MKRALDTLARDEGRTVANLSITDIDEREDTPGVPMTKRGLDKLCVEIADTVASQYHSGNGSLTRVRAEYINRSAVAHQTRNAALNLEQYPRLEGNWSRKARTSMEDHASTDDAKAALTSGIEEVETKP